MRIKVSHGKGLGQKIIGMQEEFTSAQKNLVGRKRGRIGHRRAVKDFDRLYLETSKAEQALIKQNN